MRSIPTRETKYGGTRRPRASLALAIVLPLTAFMVSIGATAAMAEPAAEDVVTQEFVQNVGPQTIDNQEALSAFRGWLADQPGVAGSGYVGMIDNLANKATIIMWYG